MNHRLVCFALSVATLLLVPMPGAQSCGPDPDWQIYFHLDRRPDFPLEDYAAGKLGILQPDYADVYLYVAYRYLNRIGFTPEEQRALVALWREKFGPPATGPDDGVAEWLAARRYATTVYLDNAEVQDLPAVLREGETVFVYRDTKSNSHYGYLNCPPDAFVTAAKTLRARIDQFGATRPYIILDWVQAQDQVFANCREDEQVPPPAPTDSPTLIKSDRNYQIAAAHFYAQNFDAAEQAFRAISADATSPWQLIAPYLVGRTLVRKATLSVEAGADPALLAQAEEQFKQILSDSSRAAIHPAAARMLNFVRFRTNPEKQRSELAVSLLRKNDEATLGVNLWDYTLLLERVVPSASTPSSARGEQDDLTDWLRMFHIRNREALEYALQKWEQTRSEAWLVAALTKIGREHPKTPSLIAAGTLIGPDSPGFATAQYHSVRLLIAKGERDEARHRLDTLLATQQAALPPTALNRFRALRMGLARNLDEFLTYAPRFVVDVRDPEEVLDEKRRYFLKSHMSFDTDAATLLSRDFPLDTLVQASLSRALPNHLRREIALTAWVNAILIGDENASTQLAAVLHDLSPELANPLEAYRRAPSKAARKFTAIHTILRFPALQPHLAMNGLGLENPLRTVDHFTGYRWCSVLRLTEPAAEDTDPTVYVGEYIPARPIFLSKAQTATAQSEWEKLSAIPISPNYLAVQVIQYATTKPDDPRVPEALHFAVQLTRRISCKDNETTKFSEQAFQMLHRRYPKSEWTAKTKYHY